MRSSSDQHDALPPPTPCRNSCTSSSGDIGSPASIGCVVDSVSARKQPRRDDRLDRDAVAVRLEQPNERVAVGHRAPRHLVEARADARHQPPDVDDALLDDHDRGGERRPRTARSAGMSGERGFERRRVERGLDDRRR